MDKILKIINLILENNGKSTINEISSTTNLRFDCGLDSIELAELTVHIEDEFGIDIFKSGLIYTVGELMEKIK